MIRKIHIFGASGSGVTTLGKELAKNLDTIHYDTDDFFWYPTDPPFQKFRDKELRSKLLRDELYSKDSWVLTGSLCGWGDFLIEEFDLVIFLFLPKEIRMERLVEREKNRFGDKISPDGSMYESYTAFIEWASKYDEGDENMRSLRMHRNWIKKLNVKVLEITGDVELKEKVKVILNKLKEN